MSLFSIGDIVTRKSYNSDILFKIYDIKGDLAYLTGVIVRIIADAPLKDLIHVEKDTLDNYESRNYNDMKARLERYRKYINEDRLRYIASKKEGVIQKPGKVLHIDGDKDYMQKCQKEYNLLGIPAYVYYITEENQPKYIQSLLRDIRPDILVITGHDSFSKKSTNIYDINNYKNSKYFVDTIKEARKYEHSLNDLVIYAGACQSYFEALINAGANFASSPERVLIDIMDPLVVVEYVAFTPINEQVPLTTIISSTREGIKGIGGLQTMGTYREGYPAIIVKQQ